MIELKSKGDEGRAALALTAQMLNELVAGSADAPYQQLNRTLPKYVDDAERDFGSDLYDRMRRDPAIAAALDTLAMRTVESGMHLVPAGEGAESAFHCDFVQRALDGLEELPLEDLIFDMLDGMIYGHRVAEIVYRQEPSATKGERGIGLEVIRPKPRSNYALVTNAMLKLIGLISIGPEHGLSVPSGVVGDVRDLPNFIQKPKFCILSFGSRNGDPRGTSLIRPAYNAWWLKQQTWPQYLKFLMQFAGPSLIGYTPENATIADPSQPSRSPEEVLKTLLIAFQNGSVVALRGGSKVDLIQSQGEGRAFLDAIDLYNREMTHAIVKQTRATMEATHGSRADSETSTDLLDALVLWIRGVVARMFRQQVFKPLLALNFGQAAADRYAPRLALAAVPKPDFAAVAGSVAQLHSAGAIFPSQWPKICEMLGLPVPSPAELSGSRTAESG